MRLPRRRAAGPAAAPAVAPATVPPCARRRAGAGNAVDSTNAERAVRDAVHPERLAHRHVRCPASAEALSKAPSFTGTCRRREISPMHAFRMMLGGPGRSIIGNDRPPPEPQPRARVGAAAPLLRPPA